MKTLLFAIAISVAAVTADQDVLGRDVRWAATFLRGQFPEADGAIYNFAGPVRSSDGAPEHTVMVVIPARRAAFVFKVVRAREGLLTVNVGEFRLDRGQLELVDSMGGTWSQDDLRHYAACLIAHPFMLTYRFDDVFRFEGKAAAPCHGAPTVGKGGQGAE